MPAKRMNLQAFVEEFLEAHRLIEDVRYCWILGAGASVTSEIAGGEAFARRWFEQVYRAEKQDNETQEDFIKRLSTEAREYGIDLSDFSLQLPGTHYSELYDYRFRDDPARGFAQLEDAMRGKDPGLGYAVLARFLSQTRHRVVITVNFDNLVADAVGIHTEVFPLVIGHESLANYIKLKQARPLVLKVHRDLLLDPMSRSADLEKLQREWPPLLQKIFAEYWPIVIGYDGNDRTLMRFLADHEPLNGRLYWCHMSNQLPRADIHNLVEKHRGRLIAIEGFDELLFRLGGPLGFTDPLSEMRARYEKRAHTYTKRLSELDEKTKAQVAAPATSADAQPLRDEVKRAVVEASKEEDWWSWELKANEEKDTEKREAIYREGLKACPKSGELADWFAIFLVNIKKDADEAENYYRQAMELNPKLPTAPRNLANLLWQVKEDFKGAEGLYRLALELDPSDSNTITTFAAFLSDVKGDQVEAEKLFRRSVELSPDDPFVVGNFAWFLGDVKKNYDEAERFYRIAVSIDPLNSSFLGKFANLLATREQFDAAYEQAMKAVEAWDREVSQSDASNLFSLWLLKRLRQEDGVLYLGWLKTMLTQGFPRRVWSLVDILSTTLSQLSEQERSLAMKLSQVITENHQEALLENDPLWQGVDPIPLSNSAAVETPDA